MKVIAILMVLTGIAIGAGAALEFQYFGPSTRQFWVAVFATPAGFFFAGSGILLWLRGSAAVRGTVLVAALVMASATIAATALDVMGPPATLIGIVSALVAAGWVWRARKVPV